MVRQILIAATVAVLLYIRGIFAFAAPVAFFYVFISNGRRAGWLTVLLTIAATSVVYYFVHLNLFNVTYFGYFILTAIILSEGVFRKWNIIKLSTLAVLVPWIVAWIVYGAMEFDMRQYFLATMDQVLKMQETSQAISAQQLAYIKDHAAELIDFSMGVMPAISLLFGVLIVSLTMLFGRAIMKNKSMLAYLGNIAACQFPFGLVWLTIGFGAGYFANNYIIHNTYLKFGAFNGLIFCAGMYFLQGCLIIAFWLQRKKSPFLRLLVYGTIILFLQVVSFIIIALGLSDQWLNFRKRRLNAGNIT